MKNGREGQVVVGDKPVDAPQAAKALLKACPYGGSPPDNAFCNEERYRFEALLAELSARFVNLPAEQVDSVIHESLRRICECLRLENCGLWQWDTEDPTIFVLTHLHRPRNDPPTPGRMEGAMYFPWCQSRLLARQTIVLPSTEDAPPEAVRDRESWRHFGIKSSLSFPLMTGMGPVFGVLGFSEVTQAREWTPLLVQRLHLVAEILANALTRKRTELELQESRERLLLATEAADAGPWALDTERNRFWVGAKIAELFGLSPAEYLDVPTFMNLVHPEDREMVRAAMGEVLTSSETRIVEYRIVRPDGAVRWMQTRGRMCATIGDGPVHLTGITSDITERKETDQKLATALREVQRLRDRLHQENVYLREQIRTVAQHGSIIGESPPVQRMLALAKKVAPTGSAVLITGETGTGKELLAQAIHDMSPRRAKTMVTVNCAALPAPLIESELFGREKGAYTGAMTQQSGRFQIADGSTIFLDEIGELPLDLQAKLLRVLQDGQYERLGSHRTQKTDVRVIAATNRDLAAMVREGKFREDLFHRLNVFPIVVPPLRERNGDIPVLVWKFVQQFNLRMGRAIESIPKASMEKLRQYAWPGNVRELRNVIERAMIVSEGRSLRIELSVPERLTASPHATTLQEVERQHILDTLQRTYWKISGKGGAAEALGLLPTTLNSRMKKLGITRPKP